MRAFGLGRTGIARMSASAVLAVVLLFGLRASPAEAVNEHVFDPVLSLRGDEKVDATDQVPDPGGAHPLERFDTPCGVAVDRRGDLYVASSAIGSTGTGTKGRIDVFNPKGEFLTEFQDGQQPCSLAVDSGGNVYVTEYRSGNVRLFKPSAYPPGPSTTYGAGTIVHEDAANAFCEAAQSAAVDPSNDHLYIALACRIIEYGPASGGNAVIDQELGFGLSGDFSSLGVYGRNHDVYVSGDVPGTEGGEQRIYVLDGTTGELKTAMDGKGSSEQVEEGTGNPNGGFGFTFGRGGIAVDQSNGDVYVDDVGAHAVVDQFDAEGKFITQLSHSLKHPPTPIAGIAVDDPCRTGTELTESCDLDTYESPNSAHVYVTSGENTQQSHLYAFKQRLGAPPEVRAQQAMGITDTEALLEGEVNSNSLPTGFHFEYVDEASFAVGGYDNAASIPVPDEEAGEGGFFVKVDEPVVGLQPGTAYHFRLVANNEEGNAVGEGGNDETFSTYPSTVVAGGCPNAVYRIGPSAGLPDCRGYELVTPPDTNGRIPTMAQLGTSSGTLANGFDTWLTSADGQSLVFGIEGGSLPDLGGGGFNDTYEATRGSTGWRSSFDGLTALEALEPRVGGMSQNHQLGVWEVGERGGLSGQLLPGASYLRGPGGLTPVGVGSLGTEPFARGKWISQDGTHVIFVTVAGNEAPVAQLEPNAPPTGVGAIYDRSPGGKTSVVSLKPGDKTPGAAAEYLGTSADGTAVVFRLSEGGITTTYVRAGGITLPVATGETTFGGIAQDGSRIFYLESPTTIEGIPRGEMRAFDTKTGASTSIGGGGESIFVNVSADGSRVYFVSSQTLDPGHGILGANNLYEWDGSVHFVATVDPVDVVGREGNAGQTSIGGLGLWATYAVAANQARGTGPASDPSRSTTDGKVLVFESRAQLTPYDNAGHSEVYRYDAGSPHQLVCISCNPTKSPALSDAQLQSDFPKAFYSQPPVDELTHIGNIVGSGQSIVFQSAERLVPNDVDGKVDVYEWVAQGSGACSTSVGCDYLISSGNSASNDYLYAMTPDGHDVFFETGDLLTSEDEDGTPSIYDARADGGFAPPSTGTPCSSAEGCRRVQGGAPQLSKPGTAGFEGPHNKAEGQRRHCTKKGHKGTRSQKAVCKKTHGHAKHKTSNKRHQGRRAA